ncbi:MAG: hypothetical protein ACXAAO_05615 [Candidatus Thorarchaeota archaeon]
MNWIRPRKLWNPIFAKVLIVLIIPVRFSIYIDQGYFDYFSLLFEITDSIYFTPLTAIVALGIMLPGIHFNRKITAESISSRVRRRALILALVTLLLPLALLFPNPFLGFQYYNSFLYVPVLSISLFIILPIMNREFILQNTPTELHASTYTYLSTDFKKRLGRLRFLPAILWIGLFLSPILSSFYNNTIFHSPLLTMRLDIDYYYYYSYRLLGELTPMTTLSFVFLWFSLRFVFLRDIYRYNKKRIRNSRLISIGILAEIVPVVSMTFYFALPPLLVLEIPMYSIFFLPTPFYPILGYLYVRKSRNIPKTDRIWDEDGHTWWFEDETPLSPQTKPDELRIKVPIAYLIRSRLRRRRRQ